MINISSPHTTRKGSTGSVMLQVLLALVPGIIALTWFFGPGHLIQIAIATTTAVAAEAAILKLRNKPVIFFLKDYTAVVTAFLLALALPPYLPYWVTIVAALSSIVFAKQLYGGLGQNPFNPAMVGYALVLVSFPVAMTTSWSGPTTLIDEGISFSQALQWIFAQRETFDAVAMATPLDVYKHEVASQTGAEILAQPLFSGASGDQLVLGWEWVSIAFLIGGLYLMWRRIFTWHIPGSMLLALFLCSVFFGWDDDLYVPTTLHMLAGATMLGAFFIATDPVSASTTPLGKIIFGAGIGILVFVIRTWGAYPDAVAFAVLLMNFAAPFIDQYTQPRTYGHKKAKRGLHPGDQ
ncbi:electron transport complex subunit RsxD [Bermanella marisrubri]|uniref:Ion-translocating oxidoreductase complex subunit D n=1 Tax=Bermanella marisrubri TaxID=207949 RepID=Q1N6T3_9GAMM|nr:electron transport complex subunit RsxD [Bermanella marisrubri]EAT13509.1 predicted NADH:ubiquinone oxidoreductase, subunit RnfD [Oceanobacter sp. RED65] [Bermanella marisrubri]QIZ84310.1 electron transport complex subunit RsxD [Bermanella marisrubri]